MSFPASCLTYQHRSIRFRPNTSFNTTIGLCRMFLQIEILKSSAPRATMHDAVARVGVAPGVKKSRGLNAYIVR